MYTADAWFYLSLYLCGVCVTTVKKFLFTVGCAEYRLLRALWEMMSWFFETLAGFCKEDSFAHID